MAIICHILRKTTLRTATKIRGARPSTIPPSQCGVLRLRTLAYWIREFHFDGLRLDATQNIHDPEHPALFTELVRAARDAAGHRRIVISGEDYLQRTPLLAAGITGGTGLDQLWNDDFPP